MARPTDVEPDEGRQPDRPLGGRRIVEVRERDHIAIPNAVGTLVDFRIDRIEDRDDGTTWYLSAAGVGNLVVEHSVTA